MSIPVTFACGHRQDWQDGTDPPVCARCGERRVARVQAPAPVFRGACASPLKQES